jgi:hypothetical protein
MNTGAITRASLPNTMSDTYLKPPKPKKGKKSGGKKGGKKK